jgi:RNA polymerase sigma-70 factor (ECF subfamily)
MIMMMDSFSELDRMIRDGQGKSNRFAETLVSLYYDTIHRLAVSILGDPADADDICQETIIDALLYIDRYSPGTNLKAWLCKIAVHKCRQVQRKRKIREAITAVIRTGQTISTRSSTSFDAAVEKEKSEQIWAVINGLGERHRMPVILYYVNEFKIREIADILEIPEGTVSSRLHYAIRKLGERLKGLV